MSTKKYSTDPFLQLYHIDQCFIDNAPEAIQDLISEVHSCHFDYYTIDNIDHFSRQIRERQLDYVRDAILYYNILTKRLYKAKYSSFNEYCQTELGLTAWRCKQVIEAGAVTLKLIASGHTKLPQNCSQAYALHKLKDEVPEESNERTLVEAWEEILAIYPMHELTADKISLVIDPPEPSKVLKSTSIGVMPAIYEYLVVEACRAKVTISDYVSNLVAIQKCKFSFLMAMVGFCT